MKVPFSYLERQFDCEGKLVNDILSDMREFVATGAFTLGPKVEEFERKFAVFIGVKHAIGVASGTDALILSLRALGIGLGDEVITCAETFIATAGAIAGAGATPVFVDANDTFTIDTHLIEAAITEKTKAIIPVYFTGACPDMDHVMEIAAKYDLPVVEDSCCGIDCAVNGRKAGSIGITGTFSFHPLKNLNVWSDGGMITTNDDALARKLRLLRNHGLVNRDEVECFGFNSRLDALQAVVALRMIDDITEVTDRRIEVARLLDEGLQDLTDFIEIPKRNPNYRDIYHLYMLRVKDRDGLLKHCHDQGVEAKVHYPIPLPYQQCCQHLGYKPGDFPKTERDCASIITLPSHQHLTDEEVNYMIKTIRDFYSHDQNTIRRFANSAQAS